MYFLRQRHIKVNKWITYQEAIHQVQQRRQMGVEWGYWNGYGK